MVKKYMLEVEDKLWKRFKETIPSTKNINKAIIELIKAHVEANKK